MKLLVNVLSFAALGLLTVPAFLYLAGRMSLPTVKLLMLVATVLWFACMLPRLWQNRAERN
jgi:hypothetical protein